MQDTAFKIKKCNEKIYVNFLGKGSRMCKVSICIPAYNDANAIKRLLNSIFVQSYKDYEIIITDDSITDEVQNYVSGIGSAKIQYYRNTKQLGATDNCNAAISKAAGMYIKMMHHDDWFSDCDSLESFVKMLDENEDADIAFSGTNQVCSDTITSRCIADDKVCAMRKSYRTLYRGNWIGAPSATIIRNKDFLFDSNLKWLVDSELYMRILRQNPKFAFSKKPLISIGIDETQLSRSCEHNWKLHTKEYFYVMKKYKFYRYIDCIFVYMKVWALYIKNVLCIGNH